MNKNWYKNSIVIIALLVLFFPVGLFLMWKYANWNKVVKWVITGVFVLLVISSATSSKNTKTENTSQTNTPQAQQATTTPQPTKEAKSLTMTDKLWVALDNSMKTRDGYSVEYNESSKTASVTKTSTEFWDETSMVRGSFTTLVKFGTEAFKINGVEAVRVVTRSEFTDQYGKKGVEDAVRIIMNKSEFSKFDWNGLKYQSVYSQIKNASEGFYIHPAVLKNLDTSKLYLSI